MKSMLLVAVALTALGTTAASAQGWRDDDSGWQRERGWHRGWDRDDWRRRHWSRGDCRTVVIRSEDDWGNVRVKRVRRCN